jgi:formate--tetrahydrofolate ligase
MTVPCARRAAEPAAVAGGDRCCARRAVRQIAQGTSSVIDDRVALALASGVHRAGFGADSAGRSSSPSSAGSADGAGAASWWPPARAQDAGGVDAWSPASRSIRRSSPRTSPPWRGAEKLEQGRNVTRHGVPCVGRGQRLPTDTPAELEAVREAASRRGAWTSWPTRTTPTGAPARGARGGRARGARGPAAFARLPGRLPLAEKIEVIAREVYGADGSTCAGGATSRRHPRARLRRVRVHGEDPPLAEPRSEAPRRPRGFRVTVRRRGSRGGGFVTTDRGRHRLMRGCPRHPRGSRSTSTPTASRGSVLSGRPRARRARRAQRGRSLVQLPCRCRVSPPRWRAVRLDPHRVAAGSHQAPACPRGARSAL